MTNTKLLLLLPLLLLVLPELAYASGCGSSPSGAYYCQQLSIQNTQSSATTANTQIMLSYNALAYQSYLAANIMNIEAYNSVSGAIIPMWLEGNVLNEQQTSSLYTSENIILWLKLPDTIAASSTDSNIYLAYFSTTADKFSASGNYGAAPQLYCASGCPATSYAGVDNGNVVFNNYWNFEGTTIPSGLNAYGDTGNVIVNNGITIEPDTNAWTGVYSTATISAPAIMETYGVLPSTTGDGDVIGGYASYAGGAGGSAHPAGQDWAIGTTSAGAITAWTTSNTNPFPTSNTIFGFYFVSGALAVYGNYVQEITLADSVTSDSLMLGRFPNSAFTTPLTAIWLRTRTYPPSGVMPATTFGSLQSASSISLSISPNPATYGQSPTITATCIPITDTCAIDYHTLGSTIATGTGTASHMGIIAPLTELYASMFIMFAAK